MQILMVSKNTQQKSLNLKRRLQMKSLLLYPYRVVNVGHLQQVLGAAVLLHLYGLPAPLHGYAVTFREVCVRGHLQVSTLEDDLVDVILVFPLR